MANIYVRKSGNDANDGSTPELAKLTIAGAISAMNSGDIVRVGAGIYREQNIDGASKNIEIIADTTGEYTGDFGEVIWSGLNANDDTYTAVNYGITNADGYNLNIKGFIFENWRLAHSAFVILKNNTGDLSVENIKAKNIFFYSGTETTNMLIGFIRYSHSSSSGNITLKNIYINGLSCVFSSSVAFLISRMYGIHISIPSNNSGNIEIENIKINNMSVVAGLDSNHGGESYAYGFYSLIGKVATIKNIEISNIICYGESYSYIYGIYMSGTQYNLYNNIVQNLFTNTWRSDYKRCPVYGFYAEVASTAYNCSSFNLISNYRGGTMPGVSYTNITENNDENIANYTIPKIEPISRFSPLLGQGNTTFPATDIEGNPRPAYGNGTACNIGVSEATNENVQREATIKDSGDYSIKVSPCNYFKKVFQVPVEATKLRTVKVKIRIDGTWGSYLPRISLSGQGMTLSTATKNATTGSFEELTVSGTPTTNGIALLTIEAHSASTDAVFYIDTITIE